MGDGRAESSGGGALKAQRLVGGAGEGGGEGDYRPCRHRRRAGDGHAWVSAAVHAQARSAATLDGALRAKALQPQNTFAAMSERKTGTVQKRKNVEKRHKNKSPVYGV